MLGDPIAPMLSIAAPASTGASRVDPLADVWESEIVPLLVSDEKGVLQATGVLSWLQDKHPGQYDDGLLRTLQRRIRDWRALHGPPKEVFFEQEMCRDARPRSTSPTAPSSAARSPARLLDRWAWQPNVQRCRASNPTAYRCRVALSVYAHAVTSDPARISVTAKVSAYYRKFSDIAFAAEVATLIGADEAFAEIVREHALEPDKLTFYAPMFEARYKSITQLIGECGATQVLELASGYSLRGLDLTQTSSLHYVETDLRDVVATKLDLLEDVRRWHNIAPRPLHAVTAADVLDLGQLQIAAAGFDRGRSLVILCEGLVGYLTREETGCLTRNVHSLLGEFTGGWWIVPDFAFKTEIRNLPPERIRLREAITGVTQRQLDASAFEDGDDLAAFLHRVGFDMQVCSQVDKTTSFSTIAALNLSPAVIERMRPVLRVWLMRLVPRIQSGGS